MPRGGARPGAGRKADPNSVRQKAAAKRASKKSDPKPAAMTAAKGFTAPDGKKAAEAPANWPFGTKPPEEPKHVDPDNDDGLTDEQRAGLTPLEYLLAVMRSPEASKSARMQAAIQAAPYVHPKPTLTAKKDAAEERAKKAASGRFGARPAPLKLVGRG